MDSTQPHRIKAVLFDFDGTLTQPGAIDFRMIKEIIGCPATTPVLEFIRELPSAERRKKALDVLNTHEIEAAKASIPHPGAEDLIQDLRDKGIFVGIITRNSRQCVELALDNFQGISISDFHIILTRDDPFKPKPDPDGIFIAAETLGISAEEILVVGDFVFDIQAGYQAGAITVFMDVGTIVKGFHPEPDYTITRLEQLRQIVRKHLPLPMGKVPADLLENCLSKFNTDDPSVLIPPQVGEDVTAIHHSDEDTIVVKSDPITFTTEQLGQYAVTINANDIATSGAVPRWMLTTLLFPVGSTPLSIIEVMEEIHSVCHQLGITLCGGHTEITDAVTRPVVSGMMMGTLNRSGIIDKKNIRTGDCVLMTKAVAVEGTAIIARELGHRLLDLGLSQDEIDTCARFVDRISILNEARIAADPNVTSAMHDITEGGLATALEELSIAGNHKIRVHLEKIPVFPQTRRICQLFDIDPLGLIGSGSLLICCRNGYRDWLQHQMNQANIAIQQIGEVLEPGRGIIACENGKLTQWPRFEVDELARLFDSI